MENFTPILSTIGGLLIGLGAAIMMVFNGRIAGISGIFDGVVLPQRGSISWKGAFVAGLVVGGFAFASFRPELFAVDVDRSLAAFIVGGLFVGFGTRLGNGCTSGHGVCGMGRFSRRSLVATLCFMASAAVTVFIVEHVVGGGI